MTMAVKCPKKNWSGERGDVPVFMVAWFSCQRLNCGGVFVGWKRRVEGLSKGSKGDQKRYGEVVSRIQTVVGAGEFQLG